MNDATSLVAQQVAGMYGLSTDLEIKTIQQGINAYVEGYLKLCKEESPYTVAVEFMGGIDNMVEKFKNDEFEKVICKKGCDECCKMGVCISYEEAQLLVQYAKENKIAIDKNRLKVQSEYDSDNWAKLRGTNRECVFLKKKECSVYEVRPAACRAHFHTGKKKECDITTKHYKGVNMPYWMPLAVQMVNAAITIAGRSDYMAVNLLKVLEEKKEKV
jgi:Fe-S-cluster containining protein